MQMRHFPRGSIEGLSGEPAVSSPRSYAVFDVPIGLVDLDEARLPTSEGYRRVSDLVALHRLADRIPPVHTVLTGGRAQVVGGHEYIQVARILGRERVRTIVRGPLDPQALAAFAAQPGVEEVDFDEVLRREAAEPIINQWHLICFKGSLSQEQREEIRRRIGDYFAGHAARVRLTAPDVGLFTIDHLGFDLARPSVHFTVRVLAEERSWYGDMLAFLRRLDAEVAPVDTHQGHVLP